MTLQKVACIFQFSAMTVLRNALNDLVYDALLNILFTSVQSLTLTMGDVVNISCQPIIA